MHSPYINTKLATVVALKPHQMDNKLYINLKKNLEEKLLGKCYKHYGYITNIYKILEYKNGIIEAEDIMSSALFDIEFSCRLCRPLKNQIIVAQIEHISKVLITANNGPILVIITSDRINNENFFIDNNNNIRYKKKEGQSKLLESKDFVKIIIISTVFNHGDERIKALGILDNMATEEEIKKFYQDLYNTEEINIKKYQDYQDYVKGEYSQN